MDAARETASTAGCDALCLPVRIARAEDAASLGEIHVRPWLTAYRGELPEVYLDGLKASDRAAMWAEHIGRDRVVVFDSGTEGITGFAAFGPSSDPIGAGELFAMNVDPSFWRHGHGAALLGVVVKMLTGAGHREAVLWTSSANHRAQSLYMTHGWALDGAARQADVLGVTVDEVRFRRAL